MPKKILIGIDLGTTVLKVGALDAKNGSLLAHAVQRLPTASLPQGGREQKTADIDRAFQTAITKIQKETGSSWRHVEGIGLAAQGGSSTIANRSSGKALTPMILWDDGRTHAYTGKLAQQHPPDFWRQYTQGDSPPAGLGRLMWLKETQPKRFHKGNIHIGAGEYLFHRLTGVWRQDAGNAIQIGSYHARKKKLFSGLLQLADIPLTFVAPLRQGHELTPLSAQGAKRLKLPKDVPVAGPYIDQETGYLSASEISSHPLQCSLGTAWVGNFVLSDGSAGQSPTQLVIPSPIREGRLVIQPLLTGNLTWEWGLRQFIDKTASQSIEKAGKLLKSSLLPKDDLFVLPWLTQPNPMNSQSIGAGLFHGINTQTSRADMLRALAAGMCCELARVFENVKQHGAIDCVVLGGGASKGAFFRKLISALFAPIPVEQQMDIDLSTARGSVYAFNSNIAQTKTRKIKLPKDNKLTEIQDYYWKYLQVYHEHEQSIPMGTAFHFGKEKT